MDTSAHSSMISSCSFSELHPPLRIGGFVPLTTLDYPDHLACVLFCQGCAWRCRYCHNPQLIPPRAETTDEIHWDDIKQFLIKRQGLLQAVVFSGGEPTLQRSLPIHLAEVKELGYLIGLHSAGIKPSLFKQALNWADWVGFDIKALPEDHQLTTCTQGSGEANWLSLQYLLESNVNYEVRTTVHWHLFNIDKLKRLAERLKAKGVNNFVVQCVRHQRMLDQELPSAIPPLEEQQLWDYLHSLFAHFTLRGR